MTDGQLLTLISTFIVAGGGAYLGSYLREKGKGLATKEDIGNITTIVEQVKVEVARQDWTEREWVNLRRVKLEELLVTVQGVMRYVESEESAALDMEFSAEPDARDQMDTLADLYFPELGTVLGEFRALSGARLMAAHELRKALRTANGDLEARAQAYNRFSENKALSPHLAAGRAVRLEARELLLRIMPLAKRDGI